MADSRPMGAKGFSYVARQPIYERNLELAAFELLYRGAKADAAGDVTLSQSASTLVSALMEIGLENLVGENEAYINLPQGLLSDEAVYLLPADKVTLEILEDTAYSDELASAVKKLRQAGYRIALDDFTPSSKLFPLVPFVDVIKVDVLACSIAEVQEIVRRVRRPGLRLLAEKVETRKAFEVCRHLGFDLFQGFFFSKPALVQGSTVPCNRPALLALLAKLQQPDVSLSTLESIIEADLGLSYRLLRFLRSAAVAADSRVSSIRQAVMLLGLRRTSALAAVLALSGVQDMPSELLNSALVRAKMCEETAVRIGAPGPDQYFTVGLFSLLDVFLDMPMQELLEQLPFTEELANTLLGSAPDSTLSKVLRFVQAVEVGDWQAADACDLGIASPSEAYISSLRWAEEFRMAA